MHSACLQTKVLLNYYLWIYYKLTSVDLVLWVFNYENKDSDDIGEDGKDKYDEKKREVTPVFPEILL